MFKWFFAFFLLLSHLASANFEVLSLQNNISRLQKKRDSLILEVKEQENLISDLQYKGRKIGNVSTVTTITGLAALGAGYGTRNKKVNDKIVEYKTSISSYDQKIGKQKKINKKKSIAKAAASEKKSSSGKKNSGGKRKPKVKKDSGDDTDSDKEKAEEKPYRKIETGNPEDGTLIDETGTVYTDDDFEIEDDGRACSELWMTSPLARSVEVDEEGICRITSCAPNTTLTEDRLDCIPGEIDPETVGTLVDESGQDFSNDPEIRDEDIIWDDESSENNDANSPTGDEMSCKDVFWGIPNMLDAERDANGNCVITQCDNNLVPSPDGQSCVGVGDDDNVGSLIGG